MSGHKTALCVWTVLFAVLCVADSTNEVSTRETYRIKLDDLYKFTKDSLVPLRSFFESAFNGTEQEDAIFEASDNSLDSTNSLDETGRTFGHRRRVQFALLPIMYKMGVMTTLLLGLTVLTLKGLTMGVILLIFAFGNLFSKFHKHHQPAQPIHVHVHPDVHGKPSYSSYNTGWGSGPWDRTAEDPSMTEFDPRYIPRWQPSYSFPMSRHPWMGYRVT